MGVYRAGGTTLDVGPQVDGVVRYPTRPIDDALTLAGIVVVLFLLLHVVRM